MKKLKFVLKNWKKSVNKADTTKFTYLQIFMQIGFWIAAIV